MRILIRLDATRDAIYDPEYHHKLRGVIWNYLERTPFSELHGKDDALPFCFSNPFPVGDVSEGDRRNVLISSPHEDLIQRLSEEIQQEDDFHIGELPFSVAATSTLTTDVGEPGTTGTLRTATGVYIPLKRDRWEEFGINPEYNSDEIGWVPDYSLGLFRQRVRENLDWKHRQLFRDYLKSPEDGGTIFQDWSLEKVYSVDVPVVEGYEWTFLVSKWTFGYQVRNNDHRRWLNLALDAGIGARNSLGFGFVNDE
jgi:CRISPR-associated endoribonuclease Cas6